MKKILIIGSKHSGKKNNPSEMAAGLRSADIDLKIVYWEDMLFEVKAGMVRVLCDGVDILADKPSLVIAIGWYKNGKKSIYRDMAFSLALMMKNVGIKFWNSEMVNQRSITKLSCMVQLALAGIPVPDTYFSLDTRVSVGALDMPFIAKAASASRGVLNFLIKEDDDLKQVYDADSYFIIQPYLENDHDLRVICFDGAPKLILKRSRHANVDTHLNNTSMGANASWIDLNSIKPDMLVVSEKICKVTGREMAGIDFIPDSKSTIGYSCLEVNAIPQLTSGTDSNIKLSTLLEVINNIQ